MWVIPDIHGRLDLLHRLLQKLDWSASKLIFLGDMIDRGPCSRQVVKRIRTLQEEFPTRVIALLGNHEQLCIDAIDKDGGYDEKWLWNLNGGLLTISCYTDPITGRFDVEAINDDVEWFKTLPYCHKEPGFFFSHAPIPSEGHRQVVNKGLEYTKDEMIWGCHNDEKGYAKRFKDGTIGVCGHKHALKDGVKEPRFYDHYIYADAGCGCHPLAPLVAINVVTRETVYARPEEVK